MAKQLSIVEVTTKYIHVNLKTLFVYWIRAPSLATLVTNSVTDSLTPPCSVNLIDVTLACEDANSKLVDVISVVDVDAEGHVGNSLL